MFTVHKIRYKCSNKTHFSHKLVLRVYAFENDLKKRLNFLFQKKLKGKRSKV